MGWAGCASEWRKKRGLVRRQAGARNADEHFPALNFAARVSLVQHRAKTGSPDKCRSECAPHLATWRRRGTDPLVSSCPVEWLEVV